MPDPLTLHDFVVAQARLRTGHKPDPTHLNFLAAFQEAPALAAQAKVERDSLAVMNAKYAVFQRDYVLKTRHDTLAAMIAAHEGQQE